MCACRVPHHNYQGPNPAVASTSDGYIYHAETLHINIDNIGRYPGLLRLV